METIKTKELIEKYKTETYADNFVDYDQGYITDIVGEIADKLVSDSYDDIKKFIMDNIDWVENALDELGWDGCGRNLYKAAQIGEYMQIEEEINDNLDGALLYWLYTKLLEKGYEEIPEDMVIDIQCCNLSVEYEKLEYLLADVIAELEKEKEVA